MDESEYKSGNHVGCPFLSTRYVGGENWKFLSFSFLFFAKFNAHQ